MPCLDLVWRSQNNGHAKDCRAGSGIFQAQQLGMKVEPQFRDMTRLSMVSTVVLCLNPLDKSGHGGVMSESSSRTALSICCLYR